jgi:hypothetical protein
MKLINDILPKPHKVPKDMYQSTKIMSTLGLKYEKIDVFPDNCMLFWKEYANEKKCLECGQLLLFITSFISYIFLLILY